MYTYTCIHTLTPTLMCIPPLPPPLPLPPSSPSSFLLQLEAAQFAAANKGKGCPANWKKGSDTITANREGSLEFFKSWAK